MATAEATMPNITQIEGANLLNLIIVDDEHAIREACRAIALSLGFNLSVRRYATPRRINTHFTKSSELPTISRRM